MIKVQSDLLIIHFDHLTFDALTIYGLHRDSCTHEYMLFVELTIFDAEDLAIQGYDTVGETLSISVLRRQFKVEGVALFEPIQLLLKGGEHHTDTMHILHRALGCCLFYEVTHLVRPGIEFVATSHEEVFRYTHVLFLLINQIVYLSVFFISSPKIQQKTENEGRMMKNL